MGVKNTHFITRETALAIMHSKLQEVPDESLADMLEDFPESHFRNYIIVTQEEIEKDGLKEYPIAKIKTLNDF